MKKQSRRARAASLPTVPVRHQFDHEVPTVIHDPEEKMTALARFTRHVAQSPGKYSFWILAVVLFAGLVIFLNSTSMLRSGSTKEWSKLLLAKTPEDRVAIAKENPKSPAAVWALLQAASDYYNEGVRDLPDNRDVAEQRLKKARELYEQVANSADKDSFEARIAVLGKARTLEARNDLAKAIEQYDLVATTWPGTREAEQATQLAAALRKPEAAAFYKDLYSYTSTKFTLPPINPESVLPPLSDLTKPGSNAGAGSSVSLPPMATMPLELAPDGAVAKGASGAASLPDNVFADSPASKPAKPAAPHAAGGNSQANAQASKMSDGQRGDSLEETVAAEVESESVWPPPLSETPLEFAVKARTDNRRIDAYLASRFADYSRHVIQKIIDAEAVLVNGRVVKASYRVRPGDVVSIRLPELPDTTPEPEDIPLEVDLRRRRADRGEQAAGHGHAPRPRQLARHARQRTPVSFRLALDAGRRQSARGSCTGSTAIRRASWSW